MVKKDTFVKKWMKFRLNVVLFSTCLEMNVTSIRKNKLYVSVLLKKKNPKTWVLQACNAF